jgi:hydrogenase nickel incorporation protein HypA/HybF
VHELSIAVGLVEIASEQLNALDGGAARRPRVDAVHVRLGALSGIVEEALRFAFEVARDGTPVAGARLVVEHAAAVIACETCRAERTLDDPWSLRCPVCGAPPARLVRGREIELTALEVEDDVPAHR